MLASAVSAGLMLVTATVLAVDALRDHGKADNMDLRLYLLFGGTFAGILLAAFAAWRLLSPVTSVYRRGGLAIVCAFGTVLTMLVCIPVNEMLGRSGLIGLLVLSGVIATLLAVVASRLGSRV